MQSAKMGSLCKMSRFVIHTHAHAHAHNVGTHLSQTSVCTIVVEPILPANCTAGQVRLTGGSAPNKGRLEICISDVWTSVCPSFGSMETGVVCEQLGYLGAGMYMSQMSGISKCVTP